MDRHLLIVGIDPGTTLGYAILNLDGKLIELKSSKNIGVNELISRVFDKGDVVVVGTDKKISPSFTASFASKLGAKIIKPCYDILVKEKKILTYAYKTGNSHQMDALAAALFAYKELKPLLNKIDVYAKHYKKEGIKSKIQKLVLTKGKSIKDAVDAIEKPEEEIIKEIITKSAVEEKKLEREDFLRLCNKLKMYKRDVELLKQQNADLKIEIIKVNGRLRHLCQKMEQAQAKESFKKQLEFKEKRILFFDREMRIKDEAISLLQKDIAMLIRTLSEARKNEILKKLDNLGHKEYEKKDFLLSIQKDDVLLVDDPNIFNEKTILLLKDKVKIIVHKKDINNKTKELPFIFIDAKKLCIEENKYFALVDKKGLEEEKRKMDILNKVIEDYKKERRLLG